MSERFSDEQQRGPFAAWKHTHMVKQERRGDVTGTLVTDDVTYEMKMGKLGELAHSLFMEAQIRQTFAYRQQRIAAIFDRIGDAASKMAR